MRSSAKYSETAKIQKKCQKNSLNFYLVYKQTPMNVMGLDLACFKN